MYRLIFWLAAAYNVGFGLWAAIWPLSFFEVFELALPRYPAIWECLGMVVGLYGPVYALAALRLDIAKPLIAIGLAGKVLGPIGWLMTVGNGEWPARTFTLVTFNDLIWWTPFTLFLLEGTRLGDRIRPLAPYVCGVINGLGGLALLLILKPGTEVEPDVARRAAYITEHRAIWRFGWLVWYASAASLLGFYAWWAARLPRPGIGIAAWCVAAAGICCDWLAESLYIGWLPQHIESIQRMGTVLTGGAANGFYTLAGAILTLATPKLPNWLRGMVWVTWVFGFGLTATAIVGSATGMMITAGGLMVLFCPLAWLIGIKLR
jgi:hypothetical protein